MNEGMLYCPFCGAKSLEKRCRGGWRVKHGDWKIDSYECIDCGMWLGMTRENESHYVKAETKELIV